MLQSESKQDGALNMRQGGAQAIGETKLGQQRHQIHYEVMVDKAISI